MSILVQVSFCFFIRFDTTFFKSGKVSSKEKVVAVPKTNAVKNKNVDF